MMLAREKLAIYLASRIAIVKKAQLPIEVTEHNHVNESRNSRITGTIQ